MEFKFERFYFHLFVRYLNLADDILKESNKMKKDNWRKKK